MYATVMPFATVWTHVCAHANFQRTLVGDQTDSVPASQGCIAVSMVGAVPCRLVAVVEATSNRRAIDTEWHALLAEFR